MVLDGNNLYFDNYRLMLLDSQLNLYLFNRYNNLGALSLFLKLNLTPSVPTQVYAFISPSGAFPFGLTFAENEDYMYRFHEILGVTYIAKLRVNTSLPIIEQVIASSSYVNNYNTLISYSKLTVVNKAVILGGATTYFGNTD
jgi:hypothetical protein